jgi:lysozyme family protein
MADFLTSFEITMKSEGGYNPGTGERETYKGIDRGANPNWSGWAIIDSLKPKSVHDMNEALSLNANLQSQIQSFYKFNYWDVLQLDKVNDQQIANNLADCSINQGSGIAAKFMQIACGVTVDGIIGPQTIGAINSGNAEDIYNSINTLRKSRYSITKNFAQWGHSWLGRLIPYQS